MHTDATPLTMRGRLAFALALAFFAVIGAIGLTSCGHEPEIATPPNHADEAEQTDEAAADEPADNADENADEQANAENENAAEDEAAADDQAQDKAQAEEPKHEGPFAIAVRNGGGADGLAASAQELLESKDLKGDNYTYDLETYLGGIAPETIVYVTGEGDDAEEVRAEADKIVKALGVGTVATFDKTAETAAGEAMGDADIFVVIGQDAASALQ